MCSDACHPGQGDPARDNGEHAHKEQAANKTDGDGELGQARLSAWPVVQEIHDADAHEAERHAKDVGRLDL